MTLYGLRFMDYELQNRVMLERVRGGGAFKRGDIRGKGGDYSEAWELRLIYTIYQN